MMWRYADGCESLSSMATKLKGASEEGNELGFKFWAKTAGVLVLGAIACFILLMIFARAWYAWGSLIAFGLLVAAVLFGAWLHDRKEVQRYEETINS
jgi:cell division protein FtsW (lipid II flippase)